MGLNLVKNRHPVKPPHGGGGIGGTTLTVSVSNSISVNETVTVAEITFGTRLINVADSLSIIESVSLSLTSASAALAAVGDPFLAFSDIIKGPRSGNTDTSHGATISVDGAYVSVWGCFLGETQGTSTISINDVDARVIYWGPAVAPYTPADIEGGYRDVQLIIAQVKSTASTGLGSIVVTVDGTDSNALPFTVITGRIFYITSTGNDSTGTGTWQAPLATYLYFNGVVDTPGDICYVKDVDDTDGHTITTIPTQAAPMALIAYPGSACQLGADDTEALIFLSGFDTVPYWTVSKFAIRGYSQTILQSQGHRLVGSEVSVHNFDAATGVVSHGADDTYVLGCEFSNCGVGDSSNSSLYHVVYYAGGTRNSPTPVADVTSGYEIAWNHFHDNIADRSINVFNDWNAGNYSSNMTNGKMHHNLMVDQCGAGIGLMSASAGENWVYSNVLVRCGLENPTDPAYPYVVYDGMHIASGYALMGSDPNTGKYDPARTAETVLHIWHNTLIDCGEVFGDSRDIDAGAFALPKPGDLVIPSNNVGCVFDFHNNVTIQNNGAAYVARSVARNLGFDSWSNNAWSGAGALPAWEVDGISGDPLVVDAISSDPDLRLQDTSPLRGAGYVLTAPSFPLVDFTGQPISTDALNPPDVGAYQTGRPGWAPADGVIATVSLNTIADVDPCPANNCWFSWPSQIEALFAFSSGTYNESCGALGTYVMRGGGHSASLNPYDFFYDVLTRLWTLATDFNGFTPTVGQGGTRDGGGTYIHALEPANAYYEYTGNTGWPAASHTLQNMISVTTAEGGGPAGTTIQACCFSAFNDSGSYPDAHALDNTTRQWSRYTSGAVNHSNDPPKMAVKDTLRNCIWKVDTNGAWISKMPITFPTSSYTDYNVNFSSGPGFLGTGQGISNMAYCPEWDMLIVIDVPSLGGTVPLAYWGFPLADIATTGEWQPLTVTGDTPPITCYKPVFDYRPGHGDFFVYDAGNDFYTTPDMFIRLLTPPVATPFSSNWVFTRKTFTGETPDSPTSVGGYGGFRRMVWVESIQSYLFITRSSGPVQAWGSTT